MLAIVGLGVAVNNNWPSGLAGNSYTTLSTSAIETTRVEAIVGSQNQGALLFVIAMAAIAAVIFVTQHWFRIKRTLNRGERFIVKHPWFDIGLVAVCTLGVVLTRTN